MSSKYFCDKCGQEFFVNSNLGSPLGGLVEVKSTLVGKDRHLVEYDHCGEYCLACAEAFKSKLFALISEFKLRFIPSPHD